MTNFATPTNLRELYSRFLLEKRCLDGISGTTLKWYEHGWNFFGIGSWPVLIDPTRLETTRIPEERALDILIHDRVNLLASEGKPKGTINSYLVALNSFLNWAWTEKYLLKQLKIESLESEERTAATVFTNGHVKRLVRFVPETINDARIRVISLLTLDCGITLNEALHLNKADIDYPNCLLRLRDGDQSRIVWMSPTMVDLLNLNSEVRAPFPSA
jgi:integrase